MVDISRVKEFWENNPLSVGESVSDVGTKEFFEEHRKRVIECRGLKLDERIFPPVENREHVLDLGCGPGMWVTEFLLRGVADRVTAGDLTSAAQELTKKRLEIYDLEANVCEANAEDIPFDDETFSHVNCQGVIHHTPSTQKCVAEIARVLRPGGTAAISVYYKNAILKLWPVIFPLGKFLGRVGFRLHGRGREAIFSAVKPDEIVRIYDGADNPIGKVYTRRQFEDMLKPHFIVEDIYYHYFPVRAFPFQMPKTAHRVLNGLLPFMINANVRKTDLSSKDT